MMFSNHRTGFLKVYCSETFLPRSYRKSVPIDLSTGEIVYRGVLRGCRPAEFEEAQLDRINGCAFTRNTGSEVSRMLQDRFCEDDVLTTVLKDVCIGRGIVSSGDLISRHKSPRPVMDLFAEIQEEKVAYIPSSVLGSNYFGHWLRDDCATKELFEPDQHAIAAANLSWQDMALYASLFEQDWSYSPLVFAHEAHLFYDIGFNQHKAERHKLLRARIEKRLPAKGTGKVVYVRRGKSGAKREIANELELIDILQKNDVTILEPENDTRHFIEQCLGASVFISVEGSQIGHALYTLQEGGSLLVIQPPDRFYNAHYEWTRAAEVNYGVVVGEQREAGFHVYPEEVLRMIDRLLDRPPFPG
ncbi:MAG: glycosyltransferase family 61 protein [Pseudomonadota bacterium]